jgi:hypothetical protein
MNRKTAVMLAATLVLAGTSLALAETEQKQTMEKTVAKKVQQAGARERMLPAPEVQLKRLTKGLKLTSEQQGKIRPLLQEEYAKLKEIRQDENLSPKQIQQQVEKLRGETITSIQNHLTPEQKEKHELVSNQIKANKQQRIQDNRQKRLGTKADPPPPAKQEAGK